MPLKDFLKKIVGMAAPPPFLDEKDKRRASILYFLLLLLLAAFTLLIIIPTAQELRQVRYALYIADDIVIVCLILARLGKISLSSTLVSFGLLAVDTYILFYRQGANDVSMLGLPVIIALGGLLLGKRGSLTLTGLCILCYSGIIWAEMHGFTPNTGSLASEIAISDLMIACVLLITTAVLIFFIKDSLSSSLRSLQKNERALQKANESLELNSLLMEQRVAERTKELQVANENLTTLSRLKDEFLANVSHELRTPLTSIKLYHNMLEKQPENMASYLKHMKRETDRLAHLIEDLLFLSRLDQGYVPFNPGQLDLNRTRRGVRCRPGSFGR